MHYFDKILLLAFLLFAFAAPTSAATLYFEPSVGSLGPGSVLAVDVLLDTESCVNALEADVSFPKSYMKLKDFIMVFKGRLFFQLFKQGVPFAVITSYEYAVDLPELLPNVLYYELMLF